MTLLKVDIVLIWEVILLAGRIVFFLLSPFTENVNYYRRIGGNLRLQFPHRQSQQKTVAAKVMAEEKTRGTCCSGLSRCAGS